MVVTGTLVDAVDAGREVDEAAASSEDDPHAAKTSEMVKRLTISLAGRFDRLIISFPLSFGRDVPITPPWYELNPRERALLGTNRPPIKHASPRLVGCSKWGGG